MDPFLKSSFQSQVSFSTGGYFRMQMLIPVSWSIGEGELRGVWIGGGYLELFVSSR